MNERADDDVGRGRSPLEHVMAFSLSKSARYLLESDPDVWNHDGDTEQPGLRFVLAAVVSLVRQADRGEVSDAVVDEALLHTLLSIDASRPDRVHLRVQVGDGAPRSFRDVVALLQRWPKHRIGGAVARIDTTADGHFDVDGKEAYARVASIYTIDYSNFMPYGPAVRRRFFTDPPAEQQRFLRTFLELYDANTDVTHMHGARAGAEWLRQRRVYRAQHTLVLRDDLDALDPQATDPEAVERELYEAHGAYVDVVVDAHRGGIDEFKQSPRYRDHNHQLRHFADDDLPTHLAHLARLCRASVAETSAQRDPRLVEILGALQVPPARQAVQALATSCASLAVESLPYEPWPDTVAAAMPTLTAARDRLNRATTTALRLAC